MSEFDFEGVSFTEKEAKIVADHHLFQTQLHNFRKVLNSSMPKKKYDKLVAEVLPGYLTREANARMKAEKIMKKKGFVLK